MKPINKPITPQPANTNSVATMRTNHLNCGRSRAFAPSSRWLAHVLIRHGVPQLILSSVSGVTEALQFEEVGLELGGGLVAALRLDFAGFMKNLIPGMPLPFLRSSQQRGGRLGKFPPVAPHA